MLFLIFQRFYAIIKKILDIKHMDITTIISIVSSGVMVFSLALNWVQYRSGKKGIELSNYEKQLKLIIELQEVKDEGYKRALKEQELEKEGLKRDIESLKKHLQHNSERLTILQNAVNRLIGDSCKRNTCPQRESYPTKEIMDVLGAPDNKGI